LAAAAALRFALALDTLGNSRNPVPAVFPGLRLRFVDRLEVAESALSDAFLRVVYGPRIEQILKGMASQILTFPDPA
jgi:hypothetical protein